jgi:threonine/homoserine/homoserine lactone efflux protein
MATHLTVVLAVLSVLTVMPGPDMAIVTRRALADGPADALRTRCGRAADALRTRCGPWPGPRPGCRSGAR